MRWIWIGGGLIVVLAVVGVVALLSSLDAIVERAIETYGSEVTQTPVEVDGVHIGLSDGSGSIRGLVVGNPRAFKSEYAFELGEISLQLDAATLTEDVVVVKEVRIVAPRVIYEIGIRGSNIDAISKNAAAYGGGPDASAEPADASEGTKLVIQHLYVTDGKISASAPGTGGKTLTTPLPNLHLRDIGKASGGATGAEVAQQLLEALSGSAMRAVAKLNLDTLKGVTDTGVKAVQEGGRQLGEGAAKATDGLKKLFQ